MKIVSCSDVSDQVIYEVFNQGYSDYSVKLEMPFEVFKQYFLNKDAKKEYSFIAYVDDQPVGLVLGDVKVFQGIKTMRCGGFAVIPSQRNQGIGKALYEAHKSLAIEHGCQQLFLEVLKTNDKAHHLYKGLGYDEIHDYRMYVMKDMNHKIDSKHDIIELSREAIYNKRHALPDLYINWQNELFHLDLLDKQVCLGIKKANQIIALIAMKPNGGLQFIWVDTSHRHQGYGRLLLSEALKRVGVEQSYAISSNHMAFEGFLRKMGYHVHLEQYEMMQIL